MDSKKHAYYTGVGNELILKNARILLNSGIPCVIRVPFIHGVNTDRENLEALCEFVKGAKNMEKVELLMYNKMAGAKYKMVGMEYKEEFEQPNEEDLAAATEIFEKYKISYSVSK